MRGDTKVIEELNARMNDELTAICQYTIHASVLENWGYTKLASVAKKRAIEEMSHLHNLIDRIMFLEGMPEVKLGKINIGETIEDIIENDHEAEETAIEKYNESIVIATKLKDNTSRKLFETNLEKEEEHIDYIENLEKELKDMGKAIFLTSQIWKVGLVGATKRRLETMVEEACTCGEGCTFNKEQHDPNCPAREIIICWIE